MLISSQLRMIAANSSLLQSYKTDLDHDAAALAYSVEGQRYVWLLRNHGTELFMLNIGRDPLWLTYWLNPKNESRAPEYLAYLVTVTKDCGADGTLEPITHERARELACEPCAEGIEPEKAISLR